MKNGIVNAAEKFGVSTPSVTNWRRTYGVTRETKVNANKGGAVKISAKPIPAAQRITTARRFTGAFRKEVAEFSISEGVARTAQRFGVSTPSVTNWRREFGINRQSRQKWLQLQSDNGIQKLAPANRREIEIMKKRLNQVVQQVDSWLDLSK
ncbi:MAG: hypothetical protein OSB09_10650 [Planctomycetota bacterium]|nr:hypothetical protein [Planctomycetota bacterium]